MSGAPAWLLYCRVAIAGHILLPAVLLYTYRFIYNYVHIVLHLYCYAVRRSPVCCTPYPLCTACAVCALLLYSVGTYCVMYVPLLYCCIHTALLYTAPHYEYCTPVLLTCCCTRLISDAGAWQEHENIMKDFKEDFEIKRVPRPGE